MANATGWRGLAYPFRFETGKPATSDAVIENDDYSHIDESIRQIIGTRTAERPFSKFVGLSRSLVFHSYSEELLPYYESIVFDAIKECEKRIQVDKVEGDMSEMKEGKIKFIVYWTLLKYNIPRITESSITLGGE